MTKDVFPGACKCVRAKRLTNGCGNRHNGFTLIELVLVVGIIAVLGALVLSTVGYIRKKGAGARAEAEISAMAAACENYKADYGVYPKDPTAGTATDTLDAKTMGDPANYPTASLVLYRALSGDRNLDRAVTDLDKNFKIDGQSLVPPLSALPTSYFTFKPNMLSPAGGTGTVTAIADPFGNSYGYSTAFQRDLEQGLSPTHGYNSTFDLWSTARLSNNPPSSGTDTITPQWIKNW